MFNRFAISLVVASVTLAACGIPRDLSAWEEPAESVFTTGPYVLIGGQDRAYIGFKVDLDEAPMVDWWIVAEETGEVPGPAGAMVMSVPAEASEDMWIATLRDLPAGPQIAYRVRSQKGLTPIYQFRIGTRPNESFRFAVFGDTRTGHGVHRAVVEAVARENIDFVLNTGDMVDRGGVMPQWDRFFQIERPLLVDTPVIPAIGNHDMSSRKYFSRYFMLDRWVGDRRYFVHDWGNFRVLVVDAGIECREGCDQYAFAEKALAEGADRGMLMAIALHFPPYSSGQHGSNKAVQRPITELARKYGVEIVFAGHDHNYERTKNLSGTFYVVSGSAGAPIRPVNPREFTASARTEPHYMLVDVEADRLALRAVNLQGDVFDSVTVLPNPPEQR